MKKNINPVALEIKSMILKSGYTQSEIVDLMSAGVAMKRVNQENPSGVLFLPLWEIRIIQQSILNKRIVLNFQK